jgi:hypothetical protein
MLNIFFQDSLLFADDTSIGHIANDKESLQDMVNLDLAYLKDWSKRWLVKFNQNKTEIMVTKNNNGPKTDL